MESILVIGGALAGLLTLGPRIVRGLRSTFRQWHSEDRKDEQAEAPPAEYQREKAAHAAANASAAKAKGAK